MGRVEEYDEVELASPGEAETTSFSPNGAAPSALDKIRERRAKRESEGGSIVLAVPGEVDEEGGGLFVRFKTISVDELNLFLKRAAKQAENDKGIEVNADLIARCCEELLVRADDSSDFEPLIPDETLTFADAEVDEALNLTWGGGRPTTARQRVFATFSPGGRQPLAVASLGNSLVAWLQGRTEEIDKEFLGE